MKRFLILVSSIAVMLVILAIPASATNLVQCPTGSFYLCEGTAGDDDMIGTSNPDSMYGYGGNDFQAGGGANDYQEGNGGSDVLYGSSGSDEILGGTGADRVAAGCSGSCDPGRNNVLWGQDGDDNLQAQNNEPDELHGGSGYNICYMDAIIDSQVGCDKIYRS